MGTWSLSLNVRVRYDAFDRASTCSGMSARDALAAVASTPYGHPARLFRGGSRRRWGTGASAGARNYRASDTTRLLRHASGSNGRGIVGARTLDNDDAGVASSQKSNLGKAGAASLAPALSTMVSLTSLYLGNNKLRAAGAASLTPALRTMTKLTPLYLRSRMISGKRAPHR